MGLIGETGDMLLQLWGSALLGTGLLAMGAVFGWWLAQTGTSFIARLVSWWVGRVVMPMLERRSWAVRAVFIFANNTCVLGFIVLMGFRHLTGMIGVTWVGICLGVAVRQLGRDLEARVGTGAAEVGATGARRWAMTVGVLLNLLEVPAIMAAAGLALHQSVAGLGLPLIWGTFALWIMPALFLAACGESLWLGTILPPGRSAGGGRQDDGEPTGFDRE